MTAAWLKGYLPASFKGASFYIKSHKYSGGRRLAEHVFPEREDIEYEDLGKKQRVPKLSGYVLADDYFPQRNDLLAACDSKGPGTLSHPYLGILEVHCSTYDEGETTEEGRLARFDLVFKRKAEEALAVVDDTSTLVYDSKAVLQGVIVDAFEEAYDLSFQPVQAIEDLNSTLNTGLDTIDKLKVVANTQAEFRRALSNTRGKLIELQLSARSLAQDFGALIDFGTAKPQGLTFTATDANAQDQYNELRALADFADEPVVNTPADISQEPGYLAYQSQLMMVYSAVASMSGLITVIPFDSAEDALALQQDYFAVLDGLLQDSNIPDELYASLRDIKARVYGYLSEQIFTLPRLVAYELKATTNTLFVSNELYGNITQEADIIARNAVSHPGFINGTLRVKVDE